MFLVYVQFHTRTHLLLVEGGLDERLDGGENAQGSERLVAVLVGSVASRVHDLVEGAHLQPGDSWKSGDGWMRKDE